MGALGRGSSVFKVKEYVNRKNLKGVCITDRLRVFPVSSHYEAVKAGGLKIKILRAGSGAVVANESAKNLARNKTEAKDLHSLLNSKGIRNKQTHGDGEGQSVHASL